MPSPQIQPCLRFLSSGGLAYKTRTSKCYHSRIFTLKDDDDPLTNGEHVEDGADDGHEQDGAKLVKEEPVWHEVAGLPDDWRQEEEEEDVRGEGDHVLVVVG